MANTEGKKAPEAGKAPEATKAQRNEEDALKATKTAAAAQHDLIKKGAELKKEQPTSARPTLKKGEKFYRYKGKQGDGGVGGKHHEYMGSVEEGTRQLRQMKDGDVIPLTEKRYNSLSDRFVPA